MSDSKNLFDSLAKLSLGQLSELIEQSTAMMRRRIDDQTLCVVCKDKTRTVRLNCAHACVCNGCSVKLDTCPICRTLISERKAVFL